MDSNANAQKKRSRDENDGDTSKIKVIVSKSISERKAGKYLRTFVDNEELFLERHKDFPHDVFQHIKAICSHQNIIFHDLTFFPFFFFSFNEDFL